MNKKLAVRLRCSVTACAHPCTLSFDAEAKIRDVLLSTACPQCGLRGSLRMQPRDPMPPASERPPTYEGPDMEGDEYLIAARTGRRAGDVE